MNIAIRWPQRKHGSKHDTDHCAVRYIKSSAACTFVFFWHSNYHTDTTTVCQCEQQPCRCARDALQQHHYIHTRTNFFSSPYMYHRCATSISTPKMRFLGIRTCLRVSQISQATPRNTRRPTPLDKHKRINTNPHTHNLAWCQPYLHVQCRQCPTSSTQVRIAVRFQRERTLLTLHNQVIAAKLRAGGPCAACKMTSHFTHLCTTRN